MIVYLAEPIDFSTDRSMNTGLADRIAQLGHSVFRPRTAWYGTTGETEHGGPVSQLNREALNQAGLLVAVLMSDQFTVGVPMEIGWATDRGIPAVVITDVRHSNMLNGNPLVLCIESADSLEWAIGEAVQRIYYYSPEVSRLKTPLPFVVQEGMATLSRGHYNDAGFDLTTCHDAVIAPGKAGLIRCGVAIDFPDEVFGLVLPRSSTLPRWGLIVLPAVIDPGWRGQMMVSVLRLEGWRADTEVGDLIPAGTRLGQLVLLPNTGPQYVPEQVRKLTEGTRGTRGFGSTDERQVARQNGREDSR